MTARMLKYCHVRYTQDHPFSDVIQKLQLYMQNYTENT